MGDRPPTTLEDATSPLCVNRRTASVNSIPGYDYKYNYEVRFEYYLFRRSVKQLFLWNSRVYLFFESCFVMEDAFARFRILFTVFSFGRIESHLQ